MGLVISLLLLVTIAGVGGYFAYNKFLKNKIKRNQASIPEQETSQDILGFESIEDGLIKINSKSYRGMIEAYSTDFELHTTMEQEQIELAYNQMLNSINFPFNIYIQTRKIDMNEVINLQKEKIRKAVMKTPQLETFGKANIQEFEKKYEAQTNTEKRIFIIVHYDFGSDESNLSDNEIKENALQQIKNRIELIRQGLSIAKINTSKMLSTVEVAEVVNYSLNRNNDKVKSIVSGEAMQIIQDNEKSITKELTPLEQADITLYNVMYSLNNLKGKGTKEDEILINGILKSLSKERDVIDGLTRGVAQEEEDVNE